MLKPPSAPVPRSTIAHAEVFPGSGLVYRKGEAMPPRVARLLPGESPDDYEADGQGNWLLKSAGKENPHG